MLFLGLVFSKINKSQLEELLDNMKNEMQINETEYLDWVDKIKKMKATNKQEID